MNYKRGQTREDGLVFWVISKGKEQWVTEEKFKQLKENARLAMIEWREKNPDKPKAWAKAYRLKNPEKAKLSTRNSIKKKPELYREKARRWRLKNRDKLKSAAKIKYELLKKNHPEKLKLKRLKAYEKQKAKNPELLRQKCREWQKRNKAKVTAYAQAREALKRKAIPFDAWISIIDLNYEIAERISRCLGIKHQVDHIFPLSKGGSHCHQNLQIIPAKFNRMKSAKLNFALPSCYRTDGKMKCLPSEIEPEAIKP